MIIGKLCKPQSTGHLRRAQDAAEGVMRREGWGPFGLAGGGKLSPLVVLQSAAAAGQVGVDLGLSTASDGQRSRLDDGANAAPQSAKRVVWSAQTDHFVLKKAIICVAVAGEASSSTHTCAAVTANALGWWASLS